VNYNASDNAEKLRVYYLGSGAIGIPVLRALLSSSEIDLVGIGTQPDRPSGRKRVMRGTPIGAAAASSGLAVDKPASVNTPAFLAKLRRLAPHLILVMAFGQLLKRPLLELATFACMNIHTSLLPRHRGASPIPAALLAGDQKTGISFMRMAAGLDTGPVYETVEIELKGTETAEDVENRLAELAAANVVKCVADVCRHGLQPVAQNDALATHAAKISKKDGEINWQEAAEMIERRVRAYTPWPRAWFELNSGRKTRRIQITQALVREQASGGNHFRAGDIMQADKRAWVIACGTGSLELLRVIPEGRPEMTAAEFLRGTTLEPGTNVQSGALRADSKGSKNKQDETTTNQFRGTGNPGRTRRGRQT
jgi:methionyl-tRNA formyltransferase